MRARFFSRYGKLGRLDFEIAQEATLGRARTNTIVLPAPAISNQHARIRLDGESDRYVLEDLGSLNGTELDGVPVEGAEPLGRLHVVTVAGRYDFIFQDRGSSRAAAADQASLEPSAPAAEKTRLEEVSARLPPALAGAERATAEEEPGQKGAPQGDTDVEGMAPALPESLEDAQKPGMATMVEAGPVILPSGLGGERPPGAPEEGESGRPGAEPSAARPPRVLLELPGELGSHLLPRVPGENVIGRTRDADVSIPRPAVSRRHAILRVEGGRVFLRDLGSANRTYVGDLRLEPGKEVEIADGASLRFGDTAARLRLRDFAGEDAAAAGEEGEEEAGQEEGDD